MGIYHRPKHLYEVLLSPRSEGEVVQSFPTLSLTLADHSSDRQSRKKYGGWREILRTRRWSLML